MSASTNNGGAAQPPSAPRDAALGQIMEVCIIHGSDSDENDDYNEGGDKGDSRQHPAAADTNNDRQAGPGRKRQTSGTLTGPAEKQQKQGMGESSSQPTAAPTQGTFPLPITAPFQGIDLAAGATTQPTLLPNGNTLLPNGKTLLPNGRTLLPNGRPLRPAPPRAPIDHPILPAGAFLAPHGVTNPPGPALPGMPYAGHSLPQVMGPANAYPVPLHPPYNFPRLDVTDRPVEPIPHPAYHAAPGGPAPKSESERTKRFMACVHNGLKSMYHGVWGSWLGLEEELEEQLRQNAVLQQNLGFYHSESVKNKELREWLRSLDLEKREADRALYKMRQEQVALVKSNDEAKARIRELEQKVAWQQEEIDIYVELSAEEAIKAIERRSKNRREVEGHVVVKKEAQD